MKSVNWLAQRERGSVGAIRLITWLTLRFGRGFGRLFLYPICLYFLLTGRTQRRASRTYLERLHGEKVSSMAILQHMHAFASTLHDRIFLLQGRHGLFDVRVEGVDAVHRALALGRGCILLGAHLGSFEMLRAYGLSDSSVTVNLLMHQGNAEKTASVLDALGHAWTSRIIAPGQPDTLLRVKECLERGEVVGMLGDRVFGSDKALACPFLGKDAPFPQGPVLMAAMLGVPVVMFLALYEGANRYAIHFEPLTDGLVPPRPERAKMVEAAMRHYVERLEYYCRRSPYNWFNFYDFWHEDSRKP